MTETPPTPADVAHLALDAAIEAARIRGARAALASARLRPGGPDPAGWRSKADAAAEVADRAARAAHDALDVAVAALGASA